MDTKSMTRKEFVTLTFTLLGSAATAAACSSSSGSGTGGTSGTGTGGTLGSTGTGGASGTPGAPGAAGTNGAAGTSGAAGTKGAAGTSGSAGTNGSACTNPLPETQIADATGHTHMVMIPASDLDATTAQTITTTGPTATNGGTVVQHTHTVTLATANLATLKGGSSVTVTSSPASDGHMHMYMVSCT
jgi:hypothetical protein